MAPGIFVAGVSQAQARCFRMVASRDIAQRAVLPASCQRLKKAQRGLHGDSHVVASVIQGNARQSSLHAAAAVWSSLCAWSFRSTPAI
jgi:hypothetical protein